MAQIISFSVDPIQDAALIHFIETLPKGEKSGFIRDAILAKMNRTNNGGASKTLDDIWQAIQEIKAGGISIASTEETEDPVLVNALANLGDF
jgi:hypothetical protein